MGNLFGTCPKCEEKECPTCDNSWSVVDDIKRIPVSGTPFTVLKMDIIGAHSEREIEQATSPLRDVSTSLVLFISPDSDYTKSDKISVITLQVPYKPKKSYVYGKREDYEKLKKASEILNNVLKEYPNWHIFSINQSFDGSYSSIINGGELAERYNKYQPLLTKEDEPNMVNILGPTVAIKDAMFSLKKEININDSDLKIVALMWRDSDLSGNLLLMPEQNTEKFCTFSDNCCSLITTIIILILIGIGLYILLSRSDKSVQRANISENPVIVNE